MSRLDRDKVPANKGHLALVLARHGCHAEGSPIPERVGDVDYLEGNRSEHEI